MGQVSTPYTVGQVSKMMGLSARVVIRLFENEKGVLIYEVPNVLRKRRGYRTIRIPRHVYERVVRRCTVE